MNSATDIVNCGNELVSVGKDIGNATMVDIGTKFAANGIATKANLQKALEAVIEASLNDNLNAPGWTSNSGLSGNEVRAQLRSLNDRIAQLILSASDETTAVLVSYEDKQRKGSETAKPGVTDTFRAVDANELKYAVNRNASMAQHAFDVADELYMQINPFDMTLLHGLGNDGVLEIGLGIDVQVPLSWLLQVKGQNVQVDSLQLQKISPTETRILTEDASLRSITDTIVPPAVPTTVTYRLHCLYTGQGTQDKTVETAVQFVAPTYYGPVNSLTPGASEIVSLSKRVQNVKGATLPNLAWTNQRFCYAYPMVFGELASIRDLNNFEYIDSFTHTTTTINGQQYHVYTLTQSCTVSNYKYIFT